MVSPQSAAPLHRLGTAQQHQHPGIGAPPRHEQGGHRSRALSGKLLDEKQARHREGEERPRLRLGGPRRAAPQGRCRRPRQRTPPPGHRGPHLWRRLQNRQRRCGRRRLHHPRRPALPHPARHVLRRAELPRRQSAPLRRYRLDHGVYRNVKLHKVADKSIFDKPMTLLASDARAPGGITMSNDGSGGTLVVEHTSDNNLMTFRFKNKDVKMQVAEEDFDLNGRQLRAGALIIPNADRAALEPQLKDLGLSAWAVAAAPPVKTHALSIPRIGYIHSWSRTQDEGWVRAALDY